MITQAEIETYAAELANIEDWTAPESIDLIDGLGLHHSDLIAVMRRAAEIARTRADQALAGATEFLLQFFDHEQ
jgi:hypothetical protein